MIEPSDAEQACWEPATRDYVIALTAALAKLQAENLELETAVLDTAFSDQLDDNGARSTWRALAEKAEAALVELCISVTLSITRGYGHVPTMQRLQAAHAEARRFLSASRALGGGE